MSAILLSLPVFHRHGVRLSFFDALFMASRAISVTGLSVIDINEVFNTGGIVLLALLFQVGGIGIMTTTTFLWLMLGQRIGLSQRIQIAADYNLSTLSGIVALIGVLLTLLISSYVEIFRGYDSGITVAIEIC